MDPLAARLERLSLKNRGRRNRQRNRRDIPSGVISPPSGLRTPVSGQQTPLSGIASRSSGLTTPGEESELDSDEEDEEEEEEVYRQPFRFFGLPYELRRKILLNVMHYNDVVDLNVNAIRRFAMFPVSRQWYHECCLAFYGGNMFRLFPLEGRLNRKRTKPILQLFSPQNRNYVTRLEVRLGPRWTDPPRCWQIEDKLGLEDLVGVRRLDVFVQCDPEHPSFVGFRKSKEFYTNFCGELLGQTLQRMPKLETVSLDSWPSVGRDSPLVRRLESEIGLHGKKILWGTHLRLDDCYDVVYPPDRPTVYDTIPIRQLIMDEEGYA